ncbi:class I SAM-dependent methyltransferase [Mucilaginibacter limnophilus]|uniref:Class I SAM-dependent methyltransferase n=1 Tax=Mucilaginibacter limnophilus TaxID=1932778 RepID=A0A3S3TKB2_9SPHI|nr:class I SAM-dependent methyltransferase [Mucilaginibacter limnophilus]RVU03012.1 class I SAM-dependent methyltransferase [Mucilaginibacter limnophilus]
MNKQSTALYDRLSFLYPLIDIILQPQKRHLFKVINNLPEGKLLEIGVGNGLHIKQYNKHLVTGIDTSAVMLKHARKNSPNNTELFLMNGEKLLFNNETFDYIVLSHVIAVVEHPEQLLHEVKRTLKPGGRVFILNHFTPDNWLRYMDRCVVPLAKIFQFKSVFRLKDLATLKEFTLLNEIKVSHASYFKILIYQK